MLIAKPTDIRYSEVTPKSLYLNRRKFLAGIPAAFLGGRGMLSLGARGRTKLPNLAKSPFSTTEKQNPFNDVSHLQQLLRVRHQQKDQPAKLRQELQDPARGPSRWKAKWPSRASSAWTRF